MGTEKHASPSGRELARHSGLNATPRSDAVGPLRYGPLLDRTGYVPPGPPGVLTAASARARTRTGRIEFLLPSLTAPFYTATWHFISTTRRTPSGLIDDLMRLPRVARASQPWALGRSPFGAGEAVVGIMFRRSRRFGSCLDSSGRQPAFAWLTPKR